MKRAHIVSSLVFLLAAAGLWLSAGVGQGASDEGLVARVLSCDNTGIVKVGNIQYGSQAIEVEILSQEHKGERFRAGNFLRAQMDLDKVFEPGDIVLVSAPGKAKAENSISAESAGFLTARDHWRLGPIAWCFAAFSLLLVCFAGFTGLNALSSFLFCCIAMWKVVIPLMLEGWSAPLVAFIAAAIMTALIMSLVGGFTKKALAAFGGAMSGVSAALALAYLFGALMHINGATLPFAQTLVNSGCANLDLADIFIAATVLAGSGAMMDLSMDISAGIREVARHNQNLGFRELFLSGVRIGRATVGTMTTTLLLAYSGGYLTLLMVFAAQGTSPLSFLNTPLVAAEIAKTLVGSFAIVLVAPFTAILAAFLFRRRNR